MRSKHFLDQAILMMDEGMVAFSKYLPRQGDCSCSCLVPKSLRIAVHDLSEDKDRRRIRLRTITGSPTTYLDSFQLVRRVYRMEKHPVTLQHRWNSADSVGLGQQRIGLRDILFGKETTVYLCVLWEVNQHILLCRPSAPLNAFASAGLLVNAA